MGEREEMEDRMFDILELSCVVCVVDVGERWSVECGKASRCKEVWCIILREEWSVMSKGGG